jgi:hypothetical protein
MRDERTMAANSACLELCSLARYDFYSTTRLVARIAEALAVAFTELLACKAVWMVQAEGRITDWTLLNGESHIVA